ncbi:MAG: hypothetical protein KDD40_02275 [Bdellovibrionales bacterium]|nr:hypothetical protein [Bdellovibrionales bacterium]
MYYLKSERGFKYVLSKVQDQLEQSGGQLQIEAGSLDIFSGLYLKNINLSLQDSHQQVQIQVTEITGKWSIHWFAGKWVIENLKVVNPKVTGQFLQDENGPVVDEAPKNQELLTPQQWIEDFPIHIVSKNIEFNNVQMDLTLKQEDNLSQLQISDFNLLLNGEISHRALQLQTAWQLVANVNLKSQNIQWPVRAKQNLGLNLKVSNNQLTWNFTEFTQNIYIQTLSPKDKPFDSLEITGELINSKEVGLVADVKDISWADKKLKQITSHMSLNFANNKSKINGQLDFHLIDKLILKSQWSINWLRALFTLDGNLFLNNEIVSIPSINVPLQFQVQLELPTKEQNSTVIHLNTTLDNFKYSNLILNPMNQLQMTFTNGVEGNKKLRMTGVTRLNPDNQLKYDASLTETHDQLQAKVNLHTPHLKITNCCEITELTLNTQLKRDQREGPMAVKIELLPAKLILNKNTDSSVKELYLNLNLDAQLAVDNILQIFNFDFGVNKKVLQSKMQGQINLNDSSMLLNGKISANLPKSFPDLKGVHVYGQFEWPWNIVLKQGKKLHLSSSANFNNLNIQHNNYKLQDVNGNILIDEDLTFRNGKLHFTHLLKQNAFERVAFNRIRHFLRNTSPLEIKTILVEDKRYGPFGGFFNLNQNLFNIHKFDFTMSQAILSGESFIDLQPNQLSLGILTRFSNFNFKDILPKKYLKKVKDGKNMSGRANLVFNLNKGFVNGRVDILNISAAQILAGLNTIDPEFKDEDLNEMRTYLSYAYPTYLGLNFNHSYMDLKLNTNVVNLPTIHSIPIGGPLNDLTKNLREQIKELPIQ